jgi:hypothetical protein
MIIYQQMLKLTTYLFFLLILTSSCKNKHSQEPTAADMRKMQIDLVEDQLNDSREKILLLSVIKQLPYDTLFSILRDYNLALDTSDENFEQALLNTEIRHTFSKKEIASFIFSFNYEMMSTYDIMEKAADDEINYGPEPDSY